MADIAHTVLTRDHGRVVAVASVSAGGVHERFAGWRDRSWRQLDRLCHSPCAGADAGGAAVGGAGEALLAAAHRSADRGEPRLTREGGAGTVTGLRQHRAVEGVPRRHPGDDRRQLAVGLRSMPVRYLFLDEVDAYPPSADDEGDPVALAEARTRTFSWRRKVFLASTPTIKGLSRIEREYEASDQRRFFVPCPHCGEKQYLKFERLRWQKGQPETAAYHCEGCEQPIAEHHKTTDAGQRRVAADGDAGRSALHRLSSVEPVLARRLAVLGADRPRVGGAPAVDEAKRSFINTVLGETWAETGEAPDWQRLYERREDFRRGTVPAGGLFLTAGADVQKDRIEVSIWAWGRGLESWLVRPCRHRRRPGTGPGLGDVDGTARRDLATSVRRFPRPGEARHRYRLRRPGGLRLGATDAAGRGAAAGEGQRGGRVQARQPGRRQGELPGRDLGQGHRHHPAGDH